MNRDPGTIIRQEATGGGLRERVEPLEEDKIAVESRLVREALMYVSNEDLGALEAVVEARHRGAPWVEISTARFGSGDAGSSLHALGARQP